MGRWATARVVAVLAIALAACSTNGLAFRQDERLRIVAPAEDATVPLPVTIEWTIRDFLVTDLDGVSRRDAGFFGVFVDRDVPRPGTAVPGLVERATCQPAPACLGDHPLPDPRVRVTTSTSVVLSTLEDTRPRGRPSAADHHEVTIVLLDGQGRRIGESAFTVAFKIDRTGRSRP
jgi:hypothetical protein